MINWSMGFWFIAIIVLIISWFLTKSWIKTGYIFQILLAIMSFIVISSANLDTNLMNISIFLSLGLLISGILGLVKKN